MVGRKGTWGFSPRCPQSVLSLLLNSLLLKQVTYFPWSQNGSLTPVFRPRAGLGRPAEEAELCPSSWWSRFIDLTLASDRVLPPPILIARALVSAEATTPSPGPCSPQPCLSCYWLLGGGTALPGAQDSNGVYPEPLTLNRSPRKKGCLEDGETPT